MLSSSGCDSYTWLLGTDWFIVHTVIFSTLKHRLENKRCRNKFINVILDTLLTLSLTQIDEK